MRAPVAALCLLLAASAAATPHVARFDLFNAATGKRVRALRANDTISAAFPLTVVAVTAGKGRVSFVTFTKPLFRRLRAAPYALGGHERTRVRRSRAVALKSGRRAISAYVDGDRANAYTISVIISRSVKGSRRPLKPALSPPPKRKRRRGPLPGEATVDLGRKRKLPIPLKPRRCKDSKPAWKGMSFTEDSTYFGDRHSMVSASLAFCYSELNDVGLSNARVRARMLSYREEADGAGVRTAHTRVIDQKVMGVYNPTESASFNIQKTCYEQVVYVEICARDRVSKLLLCDASPFQTVPRRHVAKLKLKYRPPIQLKLAPGDNFLLTTALDVETGEFTSGEPSDNYSTHAGSIQALIGVLKQRHRNVIEKTKASSRGSVVNNLRAGNTSKVSAADNGATLYVKFANRDCPANFENTLEYYNTTILVSDSYGHLVKQDSALPTFKRPMYPKTPYGEAVEVTVHARNVGGGKRYSKTLQREQPTELHYQWYLQTHDNPLYGKVEPLHGEIRPTLKLKSAQCDGYPCQCGRYGCGNLLNYYVDVCNTFGCRRSEVIKPRVLAPIGAKPKPGQKWEGCQCEFV